MNKLLLKIIFLFIPFMLNARTAVIYIDVMHRISNDSLQLSYANGIINITDSILSINKYDKVIVYISNDNAPIIITKRKSLKKSYIYDRLIGGIDVERDIQNLNSLLVEQNILGNSFNNDSIDFHFIMEIKSVIDYNYFQVFFDKLLLTNRLIGEGVLQSNIRFKVYFPSEDKLGKYYSIRSSILIKKINEIKRNYYEIIYY